MDCEIAITRICAILNVLRIKIEELIECSGKSWNVIENKDENSWNALENLIKMLTRLNYLMEIRMRTSPTVERERASNLASALVNGKKAQVEAEILLNSIKSEGIKHHYFVNVLKEQIAEEKLQLEQIERNHEREIAEKIDVSNRVKEEIVEKTLQKEEKLKNEIDFNNVEFENICHVNLENEKKLCTMRKTAEDEYLKILSKYDKNVGELYRTMESLLEESNLLDRNLEMCQEKLIIQETEYELLKNEKQLELQTIFTDNLNKFKRNRAAKIIQTAWRRYLERLLLRKKKKSKRKK